MRYDRFENVTAPKKNTIYLTFKSADILALTYICNIATLKHIWKFVATGRTLPIRIRPVC
jgi:hypothetical protein